MKNIPREIKTRTHQKVEAIYLDNKTQSKKHVNELMAGREGDMPLPV